MRQGNFIPQYFAFLLLYALLPGQLRGQGVYIGTQDTDPEAETILELESSTKGLLIPRMTEAEIEAISSPAEGLMVYNTSAGQVSYYDGNRWKNGDGSNTTLQVGDAYQGGIIFYLDGMGGGLIAAGDDQGVGVPWGCEGTAITSGNGAGSNTDGAANTSAIMTDCGTAGSAAEICDSYSVTVGMDTYDDWYLPAEDELSTLYSERDAVGGFNTSDYYWSSTESSDNNARMISFSNGLGRNEPKDDTDSVPGIIDHNVRPIRAF